jgi:hypothetical protein
MLKITTVNSKTLFLWTNAKELGKDKLVVNLAISESIEDSKKNMERVTERYWHNKLNIADSIVFDGSESLNAEGVNQNSLTETINSIILGNEPFRLGTSELAKSLLEQNEHVQSVEVLL